ncbi:MAG: hypothetical protein PHE17_18060 [Thiothrix sp.]|uniref:hypothetical protein n=1 Tax=Thiothrix sp. TaxID=1032 RepID=UPI00261F3922|nr:hypothetical protein [Thiothrix sp.]MDD5394926.1 hypothetical protein [Thiothrix sp.]
MSSGVRENRPSFANFFPLLVRKRVEWSEKIGKEGRFFLCPGNPRLLKQGIFLSAQGFLFLSLCSGDFFLSLFSWKPI